MLSESYKVKFTFNKKREEKEFHLHTGHAMSLASYKLQYVHHNGQSCRGRRRVHGRVNRMGAAALYEPVREIKGTKNFYLRDTKIWAPLLFFSPSGFSLVQLCSTLPRIVFRLFAYIIYCSSFLIFFSSVWATLVCVIFTCGERYLLLN